MIYLLRAYVIRYGCSGKVWLRSWKRMQQLFRPTGFHFFPQEFGHFLSCSYLDVKTQDTPIMTGGGVLAHTIIDIDYFESKIFDIESSLLVPMYYTRYRQKVGRVVTFGIKRAIIIYAFLREQKSK